MKKKIIGRVYRFIITATESQSKFYSGIVLSCGFILALGLCLVFRPKFEFQYVGDIVSWITVNKYPKQQEIYYYILSLIVIPFLTIVNWLLWLLWSYISSIITKLPTYYTLKKYALTHLVFILILTNISTPTFKKMLMIPLIIFASANLLILIYDVARTKLKRLTRSIFSNPDQHWCVFASGVCIGLFTLINYGENPIKILLCLAYIILSALSVWTFWLIYSLILKLITKREFDFIKGIDAYSYVPFVILLLISLLYEHGMKLMIISVCCMFLVKILSIIKPEYVQKISLKVSQKQLLDYVIVPSIIYVIYYNGGNINGGIDIFHEGERLAPLNEALRGGIPYRDVYLQHGLFYNFYRPLLASKLFGVSLASDRLLGGIIDPLGHVGFYLFALQIFKSKLSIFLLLWIMSSGVSEEFVYWSSSRRMVYTPGRLAPAYFCLAIMASYVNRRYDLSNNVKLPLIAGIFACIAIFNSLEIGLYVTVSCIIFLILFTTYPQPSLDKFKDRLMPLASFIIGILIIFIPISVYLFIHSAFDDMIMNSYIQIRYQGTIWGLRFPPLYSEIAKIKSIESAKAFIISGTFKWYLPVLVYLITATYLVYQMIRFRLWKVRSNIKLSLVLISGIVFFRTMLGRSDSTHLYGMAFAWVIGMFWVEYLFIRVYRELKMDSLLSVTWHSHKAISTLSHPISVIALRAIVIVLLFWYAISVYNPIDTAKDLSAIISGYGRVPRYVDPPLDRIGKIIIPAEQANQIRAVVDYIQKNTEPDETIFDFSNQAGYYFFADRPSATRYHQVCYASIDPLQIEVIEGLERHKTKLIIFSNSSWMDSIDGVSNLDRHKLIAQYIRENYTESVKIGTTVLYKRK